MTTSPASYLWLACGSLLGVALAAGVLVTAQGCGCGPSEVVSSELAPLVLTDDVAMAEIPAIIRIRSGSPQANAEIPCDEPGLEGATLEILDASGEPIPPLTSRECFVSVTLSGAPDSEQMIRVVVRPREPVTVTSEVTLETFQDVCAPVGSSEIVAFGP